MYSPTTNVSCETDNFEYDFRIPQTTFSYKNAPEFLEDDELREAEQVQFLVLRPDLFILLGGRGIVKFSVP